MKTITPFDSESNIINIITPDLVPMVPVYKTYMSVVRSFNDDGLIINVSTDYNQSLNVVSENTLNHSYSIENVKLIDIYLKGKHYCYNLKEEKVVRNRVEANSITLTGNSINITCTGGSYRVDMNGNTVSFSNVGIPSENLKKMIH